LTHQKKQGRKKKHNVESAVSS